ncbi:MAG: radical SAM protein [Clostridium sp.]
MSKNFNKYLNVLVIPTEFCNMRCKYCFHNEYNEGNERMSYETLEKIFRAILPHYNEVSFIWHGGEPLSMGINFFKRIIELQNKYNVNSIKIDNKIQSNLTLLNKELAEFLVENKFGVGGSFDGIKNDITRGNTKDILKGREVLKNENKNCGMIQVVSNMNIDSLIESYEDFKKKNINYTINMYIKPGNISTNELSLSKDVLIKKMCELFDYWLHDVRCNIHIKYFYTIIDYILNKRKSICTYTSCIGKWICIRPNGDITPCNRYFPNEYTYGNINKFDNVIEAFNSEGINNLLKQSIIRREKCKSCSIYDFCSGGCNNVALNENGIENNGGLSCEFLKEMYMYIEDKILNVKLFTEDELKEKINPKLVKMLNNNL